MAIQPQPQVLHGYIRWSDIFFEWEKVISERERQGLKASLNSHALVHPDHPLRVSGENGVRAYIGTLENGEKRLLISTDQADYLRRWLYACDLTDRIIPLPHSECVLERSLFTSVTREIISEPTRFKELQKTIDKTNKRLKNVTGGLIHRLKVFEQVRQLYASQQGVWLAIDFETWERDHTIISEFGWAAVAHRADGDEREEGHFNVKYGHTAYHNGTYVPDYRTHYKWGTSEEGQKSVLKQRIAEIIEKYRFKGPLFLVFHDPRDDVKALEALSAPISGHTTELPAAEDCPVDGVYVVDTRTLFSALEGENGRESRNLQRTCQMLGYQPEYMHNAGNDAHWTLKALESMAGSEVVDVQRGRRWPHHVPAGPPAPGAAMDLKVPFKPSEEDSDLSDTEGVLGRLPYDPVTGWARGYGPGEPNYVPPAGQTEEGVVGDGWGNAPAI